MVLMHCLSLYLLRCRIVMLHLSLCHRSVWIMFLTPMLWSWNFRMVSLSEWFLATRSCQRTSYLCWGNVRKKLPDKNLHFCRPSASPAVRYLGDIWWCRRSCEENARKSSLAPELLSEASPGFRDVPWLRENVNIDVNMSACPDHRKRFQRELCKSVCKVVYHVETSRDIEQES